MHKQGERRRTSPRSELHVGCTLTRRKGGPIEGRTLDLGPAGMRIETNRPLAVDELLHFDLLTDDRIDGDCRVVREQAPNVYALRFTAVAETALSRLAAMAASGAPSRW